MYPSPEQEADNTVHSTYSPTSESPYAAQEVGVPLAYGQSYTDNQPVPTDQVAYDAPTIERPGLMMELVTYPGRSIRSLCLPSLRTFAQASLHARWSVVWISIFALPLLSSVIGFLLGIATHHVASGVLGGVVLGPLITIPIFFFIIQGMIWPLSRYYRGGGTFLEQCYTTFLPLAPLFLLGSVATILIAIDSTSRIGAILILVDLLLFFYIAVLLVIALKAVHGVTGWEAFALALIPIFSILAVLIVLLIVAFVLSSSSSDSNSNKGNSNKNDDANKNENNGQHRSHYHNNYYWWGGRRYGSGYTNQNPVYVSSGVNQDQDVQVKRQWFCPSCRYRRWMRQAQAVACLRCDAPMRPTDATR